MPHTRHNEEKLDADAPLDDRYVIKPRPETLRISIEYVKLAKKQSKIIEDLTLEGGVGGTRGGTPEGKTIA